MEFFVNFAKMWVGNVSVDLSGRDVSMTEHGLDRTQIGAIHKKIGSEGMTKSVRCNMLSNAS